MATVAVLREPLTLTMAKERLNILNSTKKVRRKIKALQGDNGRQN